MFCHQNTIFLVYFGNFGFSTSLITTLIQISPIISHNGGNRDDADVSLIVFTMVINVLAYCMYKCGPVSLMSFCSVEDFVMTSSFGTLTVYIYSAFL